MLRIVKLATVAFGLVLLSMQPAQARAVHARASLGTLRLPEAHAWIQPQAPQRPSCSAPLHEPIRKYVGWASVYVPAGFCPDSGSYDLVVHFHGAPPVVERAFDRAGIQAVLAIVNLGNGSGPYEQRFASRVDFEASLQSLERTIADITPMQAPTRRRLALSSWSAGYGATARILRNESIAAMVDTVLLSDGLHAGFVEPRTRRIDDARMAPFVAFARAAVNGDKLMAVAHSSIHTPKYASTTETARYLMRALQVQGEQAHEELGQNLTKTAQAHVRGLSIEGFAGDDTKAHAAHLQQIDRTLFGRLRQRWESAEL